MDIGANYAQNSSAVLADQAVEVMTLDDIVPADKTIDPMTLDVQRYERKMLAGCKRSAAHPHCSCGTEFPVPL